MRWSALLLVPLFAVACDRQPVAPDAGVGPQLGAAVINEVVSVYPSRITWMDSQNDWDVLLLGYEPSDDLACNGGEWGAGIPARVHYVVSMQGMPDEFSQRDQYLLTTIGRPPLYMYLRSDLPGDGATDEEWCAFLKEGWVASGHWSARFAGDNDISGFDETPGINAWGGTEAGVLWGPDGAQYRYEWKYRYLTTPLATPPTRLVHSVDHVVRIR